jgi:glycosyltransferase involved in cell wall biosynthesis
VRENNLIRVLHVIPKEGMRLAGIQTYIMSLYRNIERNKIQFDFITSCMETKEFDGEIQALGGKIARIPMSFDLHFISNFKKYYKFIKEHKEYKIIHCHINHRGFIVLFIGRLLKLPVRIAHAHTGQILGEAVSISKKITSYLFPIFANYYAAGSIEAGHSQFGSRKFDVWHYAIDVDKFRFSLTDRNRVRKELDIENLYVIGNVGRFQNQKNQSFVLDIFCEIVKIKESSFLILVGEGSDEEAIKKKADRLGVSSKMKILKPTNSIASVFSALDIFLFPSNYEGLGIVTIEAQASGLPVLCSEAIPKEANITDIFRSYSLQNSAADWAKLCLESDKTSDRTKYNGIVASTYFSVENEAALITNRYYNLLESNTK